MIKINEETRRNVQEKYLDTIDSLDYEDRKNTAIENLENAKEIKNSSGKTYTILAVYEDNALLFDPSNKYHPFTVARGIYPSLRSWISGSYHSNHKVAKEVFNSIK